MTDLRQHIKRLASGEEELYSVVGTAKEVKSNNTLTVEPLNGDPLIYGVRLQSVLNGDEGLLVVPKQGSEVIVTFLNQETGYMAMCAEVESYLLKIGGMTLEMDKDGQVFNGGDNDGMVIIGELVKKLNKLESKHDGLVQEFNALVTAYNAHTHPGVTPGGASTSPPPSPGSPSTSLIGTTTKQSELENKDVKH